MEGLDLRMQVELFDRALEELDIDGDLVNQILEITADDDALLVLRYRLPATDL